MTKTTDTREDRERLVPYNGHNSDPYSREEDWWNSEFPQGVSNPDNTPGTWMITPLSDREVMATYESVKPF